MKNYYVYILESISFPGHYYIGYTEGLGSRLSYHNHGKCGHTSKFKPWKIKNAISFLDKNKATKFERYLKSGSGRAFSLKHF